MRSGELPVEQLDRLLLRENHQYPGGNVDKKSSRFHNLVVTANSKTESTEVVIQYPKTTKKIVSKFADSLPVKVFFMSL